MFEVTGIDIANLGDADLRTLVARLALAELRKRGCPLSSVTAGGNQDAADGGLDVRVQCPSPIADADFVPRSNTGFQVKKPDMRPGAIKDEMRPESKGKKDEQEQGALRQVIRDLARESGAYIIVSSQGSVADKPLADRRKAMRDALHDLPDAGRLHTDFYDRDRLAIWVNEYPGIAAWVRVRVGRGLSGWSGIGDWTGTRVAEATPYLFNDKACLTDERSHERNQLTIGEGISELRAALREPRTCIRLIGLSGLGKTRLVQALFESGIGDEPLDPGLAVYTDYSVETEPAAREMARHLVTCGQRAILIVDNCNPATHTELARICSAATSNVSLLTVEYDVCDDEPEHTVVFKLQSASRDLVAQWLERSFPHISEIDRGTIADFSDGNFRVAGALAETVGKGETLGKLKSRELFERIFRQRNQHDQILLAAAEDLSLLYSIDGEDTSDTGELAGIGRIRAVSAGSLYAALVELRRRSIVQARSRWRAILPQAIANRLATYALQRIPPGDFDRFGASLTPRMQKSLSRRLGYLHDSPEAQTTVARWLRADGPLGDLVSPGAEGIAILTNIAPVAPGVVLARIEQELNGPSSADLLSPSEPARWQWVRLIKALAYEPDMFEAAATLLARFLAAEPHDHNHNSSRDAFAELFHLHLSGTQAPPAQRRAFIRQLANSGIPENRRCASIALDALLTTRKFTSLSQFDFGARSRDWGWRPEFNIDVRNWYSDAIDLAVELSAVLDDAQSTLARHVCGLWRYGACHDALDRAASAVATVKPWIEGWIGFRKALRFDGHAMPVSVRARLEALIRRMEPSDLLHRARAFVLNRAGLGLYVIDTDADDGDIARALERVSQVALDIGCELAQAPETRREFLPELIASPQAPNAYQCGRGLASGADDLGAMWRDLVGHFEAVDAGQRNPTVLGGFIHEAHRRDAAFAPTVLEAAIGNPALARALPYLQARVAIDADGIARLRHSVEQGIVEAIDFRDIANGVVGDAPPESLSALLLDIARLADGVEIAVEILHKYFFYNREAAPPNAALIAVGRTLLRLTDFGKREVQHDHALHTVIRMCCTDTEGEDTVRIVSGNIRASTDKKYFEHHDVSYVLKALFETKPIAALDAFLLPTPTQRDLDFFDPDSDSENPIEKVDPIVLQQWADQDPIMRYPLLGTMVSMFRGRDEDPGISPLFLELLGRAPDKRTFLGDIRTRLCPRSWSGSLANILVGRRAQILVLRETPHAEVRERIDEILPDLHRWIERERMNDRDDEESFE